MKLLLFSDLHYDIKRATQIVEQARQVDVVIGAGDFGHIRGRGLDRTIDILKAIVKPTLLTPGNSEWDDDLRQACQSWPQAYVLHGNGVTIEEVDFFGLGGGIPITPFGQSSFDFTEAQAEKLLKNCPPSGVLISHSPPQGILDRSSWGENLGSTAIRRAIEQRNLQLVVCGHIHASSGQQAMLGNTTVINAGPEAIIWNMAI